MFQDRLVNDDDRNWFDDLCKSKMKSDFDANIEEIFHMEPILYGDFLSTNVENKVYAEITDHTKVIENSSLKFYTHQKLLFLYQCIQF